MRALVMPIPNKVKVGWKTYDVMLADPTLNGGDELYGQIDYDRCTITLRATASPDQQRATLVHELLHAVSDMYGLGLDEKLVTDLANALYCVYKDNLGCTKNDDKIQVESKAEIAEEESEQEKREPETGGGGIEWLFASCGETEKKVKARIRDIRRSSGDIKCIDADELVIFVHDGDKVYMQALLEEKVVYDTPEEAKQITEEIRTKIFGLT